MSTHSPMGFSGQGAIIPCVGKVRMSAGLGESTNEAAEKGTAVHELGEASIKLGCDCSDFVGQTFNGFKITKAMAENGQIYVDLIRRLIAERPGCNLIIEGKVSMISIDGELLRGTADCIIVDLTNRELIIGDYKNGYGIVEVDKPIYSLVMNKYINGNAQCVGYGLSVLDTYQLWDKIDKVTTFICQPNYDHVDGVSRFKTYTMGEMVEWWEVYYHTYHEAIRPDARVNPGEHCNYCDAAGFCSARAKRTIELLSLDNGFDYLKPEQIIGFFKEIPVIRNALNTVEEQVSKLARQGTTIEGHKLVKPILRAKCEDEDGFVSAAIESGVSEADLYNQKIKSKTALKEIMDKNIVNEYFINPTGNPVLVEMSDKRPAIATGERPSAVGRFGEVK